MQMTGRTSNFRCVGVRDVHRLPTHACMFSVRLCVLYVSQSEMAMLCKVSHKNICACFAYSVDGPQRCLVLELCTGGPLDSRLAAIAADAGAAPLLWKQRLCFAIDISSALAHLHSLDPPLLHRDVKVSDK